ncbi:hypothetical protein [Pseudidiomarina terrestris]|uniref:DUF4359 domain-containing protein n=1 Tax=Pseudidiomarina terrestris TaxID=2820060 RepID=A0AAW7QWD3_9GAMM|nr:MULTISPECIES: hypothetical protein [unclassified Pseudidiomarina]MDN7123762.1 hypothetical protein [Pseudidiomarina sp. 1APP75-32.1]MDN7126424.1 hypothetical protein [Pseudidiomarina sp. 1APR75-33.1]MDN7128514.1 hypothetical protein [Pseudidiomarina sp. 1APR75-15]MDN7135238.1 hypothetical protein [Pseudidiomarina sp. 1ASP75-5]MDN7137911.1 hypothetical protein [Pseudidiomarina sp. 1ASP75-14]
MSATFKKSFIAGVVVLMLGSLASWLWHTNTQTDSSRQRNALYQDLLELSGKLNRDLPRLLDQQTRFDRAEVVNYGMRFYYTLIRIDRFVHDEEDIERQVRPNMLREYCQGEALAFYRENADFIEFRYLDQNELTLFTLRFTPEDCD